MQPPQRDAQQPFVFTASLTLRAVCGVIGGLAGFAFVGVTAASVALGEWARILGAVVLLAPCIIAAVILRRLIVVDLDGIRSRGLLGQRGAGWNQIRRVDVRRGSFTIETAAGPISASLVDPGERERLLRLIIDRAKLVRSGDEPGWGLEAQYFPRSQEIAFTEFTPHHKRAPKQSP